MIDDDGSSKSSTFSPTTKVRAAQMQSQVANMATRISHYGGDLDALLRVRA